MTSRQPHRQAAAPLSKLQIPLVGGAVTISIVESHASVQAGGGPTRTAAARALAEFHRMAKLGYSRPSDEVESLKLEVKWEPARGVMGVNLQPPDLAVSPGELAIVSN